jgi:WD40 repeat protein
MKLTYPFTILVLATLAPLVTTLDHEKSFLLQNGASNVEEIQIYEDSLLLTASNDIVQKDIETGSIQRTFRAHQNLIQAFVTTNDSRMISAGYDDMIIVWSLTTGSILRRIWLRSTNTQVQKICFLNEQILAGGYDNSIRQVDLSTGKIVGRIGKT